MFRLQDSATTWVRLSNFIQAVQSKYMHDVWHYAGHGPFSHLFEKKVVKKIVKELVEKGELPKEYEWEVSIWKLYTCISGLDHAIDNI